MTFYAKRRIFADHLPVVIDSYQAAGWVLHHVGIDSYQKAHVVVTFCRDFDSRAEFEALLAEHAPPAATLIAPAIPLAPENPSAVGTPGARPKPSELIAPRRVFTARAREEVLFAEKRKPARQRRHSSPRGQVKRRDGE